jgi:tetratricopeptide (TPR) repeat protein
MQQSGWKRLWNALKPPPPVPHKDIERTERSLFQELMKALKPPPPLNPISAEEQKRRRRLWAVSISAAVVLATAWGVYVYIQSAPKRAMAAYQEGMRLLVSGNYKVAADRFSQAVKTWPQLADAYYERGIAHQSLHEDDAALEDFHRAVAMNPSLASAHTAIGSIYNLKGDPKKAMDEFSLSISVDSNVDAYYQRGRAYETIGDHKKAIEDYTTAIAQRPEAPYVYLARAAARANSGDAAGAAADRKMAEELEFHGMPKP